MKKIIMILAILGISNLMGNEAFQSDINKDGNPFVVGNTMIMVYTGGEYKEHQDKNALAGILKNMVCKDESIKEIIKSGTQLAYIYIHDKKITTIYINKCD